jgi:hypothetical protein
MSGRIDGNADTWSLYGKALLLGCYEIQESQPRDKILVGAALSMD